MLHNLLIDEVVRIEVLLWRIAGQCDSVEYHSGGWSIASHAIVGGTSHQLCVQFKCIVLLGYSFIRCGSVLFKIGVCICTIVFNHPKIKVDIKLVYAIHYNFL